MPMQTWSSALFHFLLASQISTGDEGDKGNREEMRVMVCGKELSFGKKEFALISGLSFRKSDHNFSRPATKPCLKMKHFPDEVKPVTGKRLKLLLFGKVEEEEDDDEKKSKKCSKKEDKKKSRKCHRSSKKEEEEKISRECHQSSNSNAECEIVKVPLESDDKVKLSLLYVVHRYVLGKGDEKVVEHDHWYLVHNLVDFNSYPWAEIAFSRTIDNSNSALDYQINANKPVGSEVTYKSQGMAHVLVVWGLEVLPKVLDKFGSKTIFANWRPHMHSVTCDLVIHHEPLLTILEESKGEVCDDIMWHKEDAKRLVMLGLCEGPLVDDEEEVSLKNENVVENEDLLRRVPEESSMDDEEDEEDLLGNENVVEEKDLFEKDEEEARVAHPRSQLMFFVLGHQLQSLLLSVFVKNAMIGHTEDLKMTVIGEMEVFKSAVKGQLEELSVQTYNALSKTKTGTPPGGHNEEGDFDGAAMQKPDVTPGNGSNSIELNPPYPYNPPNKEVDVSRAVVKNICNSSTGKKRKRQKNKPCTGPSAPIIVLSDDVTKGREGGARRKINPAPSLLPPYTPTGKVAKKNAKKVPTSEEPVIMNYFEEDTLDQQITKQDIDDVNRFINLGIKEHGDNYNGDGTSLLSCSEYKLLLRSTGWLCGNIIDSALVFLHKSYPSNKSTGTWSYFESHLPGRGSPPSEHLPSWDKVDVVYGVVCIENIHWVAVSIQVKEKTIIIYDSLRPNRNNRSSKIHPEVGQIRDYLEKAYNRGPWWCRYDLKTPKKNDTNSCGVFAFKFIEHMVRKIPVCEVEPAFATRYRCELAVQQFKKQFIEVNGTSGE
ncbi:hypothetical protein C5167_017974 [Papaver somniferum]|uniref:Ubiquitin-like protease family profile domain-containing protein n=1 Tax=Papaver somniferum TaxID=3469 RepID=A0A4Y7IPY9_PAPSO|nr:hypothetical protein C5167_017974 [Papaver somniferum]